MSLICPLCDAVEAPAAVAGALQVCARCGRCLYVAEDGAVRVATGPDLDALPSADLTTLRKAHGRVTRGARP